MFWKPRVILLQESELRISRWIRHNQIFVLKYVFDFFLPLLLLLPQTGRWFDLTRGFRRLNSGWNLCLFLSSCGLALVMIGWLMEYSCPSVSMIWKTKLRFLYLIGPFRPPPLFLLAPSSPVNQCYRWTELKKKFIADMSTSFAW